MDFFDPEKLLLIFSGLISGYVALEKLVLEKRREAAKAKAELLKAESEKESAKGNNFDLLFEKTMRLTESVEKSEQKYKALWEESDKRALVAERKVEELAAEFHRAQQERDAERAEDKALIQKLQTELDEIKNSQNVFIHHHVREVLWNRVDVGWAFVGHDGVIREGNKTLHKMLKYPFPQLSGLHFAEITAEKDVEPDLNDFVKLIRGDIHHYHRLKTYKKQNGEHWLARLDVFYLEDENYVLGRVAKLKEGELKQLQN